MASPRKPSALAVLERSATSMLREQEEMLREHEAQEMEALDAELAKLEAKSATLVDDFNSTTKNLDAADEYSRQRRQRGEPARGAGGEAARQVHRQPRRADRRLRRASQRDVRQQQG